MRYPLCLVYSLFFSVSLFAQGGRINFSKLDIYHGLSHNQVNTILRDQHGFLWFGTMSGLNRYDGYSFKVFRNKAGDSTSMVDNYVGSLYQLPEKKIWVVTRNIPCIYDARTEKFNSDYTGYLHSLNLPGGAVSSVVKGENERYWFLYDSLGLFLYSHAEKKTRTYPFTSPATLKLGVKKITCVKEVPGGFLWVVYQNGLLQKLDIRSN